MEGIKLTIDNVAVDFGSMDKILSLLLQSSKKEVTISGAGGCKTPDKPWQDKSPKRTPLSSRKANTNQNAPAGSAKKTGTGAKLFPVESMTDKENQPQTSPGGCITPTKTRASKSVFGSNSSNKSTNNSTIIGVEGTDGKTQVVEKVAVKSSGPALVPDSESVPAAHSSTTSIGGKRSETCMQRRSRDRILDGTLLLRKAQALKKSQRDVASGAPAATKEMDAAQAAQASTAAWEQEIALQQSECSPPASPQQVAAPAACPAESQTEVETTAAAPAACPAESQTEVETTAAADDDDDKRTVQLLSGRIKELQHQARASDGETRLLRFSVEKLRKQLQVKPAEAPPVMVDAATEVAEQESGLGGAIAGEVCLTTVDLSDWLLFFIKHQRLMKQMIGQAPAAAPAVTTTAAAALVTAEEEEDVVANSSTIARLLSRSECQSGPVSPAAAAALPVVSPSCLLGDSRLHHSLCSPEAQTQLLSPAQAPVVEQAAAEVDGGLNTSLESCDKLEFLTMQDMLLGFSAASTPASAPRSAANTAPGSGASPGVGFTPVLGELTMSATPADKQRDSRLPASRSLSRSRLQASGSSSSSSTHTPAAIASASSQSSAGRGAASCGAKRVASPAVRMGGFANVSGALHTTTGHTAGSDSPAPEDYTQDILRYFQTSPAPAQMFAPDTSMTPANTLLRQQSPESCEVTAVELAIATPSAPYNPNPAPSATPGTLRSAWRTWAQIGGRERAQQPAYEAELERLRHFNSPAPPLPAETTAPNPNQSTLTKDKYRDIVYKTAKGETLPILSPATYREVVSKLREENQRMQEDIAQFRANLRRYRTTRSESGEVLPHTPVPAQRSAAAAKPVSTVNTSAAVAAPAVVQTESVSALTVVASAPAASPQQEYKYYV